MSSALSNRRISVKQYGNEGVSIVDMLQQILWRVACDASDSFDGKCPEMDVLCAKIDEILGKNRLFSKTYFEKEMLNISITMKFVMGKAEEGEDD